VKFTVSATLILKRLGRGTIYLTSIIVLTLGLRALSIQEAKTRVALFAGKTLDVPQEVLKVGVLNFVRGDYAVSLRVPPFRDLIWTVNLLTGQWVSWQSQRREESILKWPRGF
jgi:hypothetical protein